RADKPENVAIEHPQVNRLAGQHSRSFFWNQLQERIEVERGIQRLLEIIELRHAVQRIEEIPFLRLAALRGQNCPRSQVCKRKNRLQILRPGSSREKEYLDCSHKLTVEKQRDVSDGRDGAGDVKVRVVLAQNIRAAVNQRLG